MLKLLLILAFLFQTPVWAKTRVAKLEKATKKQKANISSAKASQQRIEKLSAQRQSLLQEYRTVLKKIENSKVYNNQLRGTLKSQTEEMNSIRAQIETVKETAKDVIPLMVRMIDNLAAFVELDLPFLVEERTTRVAELRALMKRPDSTTSEKYRRIIEAYQAENQYGNTIEAYRGLLKQPNDQEVTVDYLRIGRVSLIYQTLDKSETAVWSREKKRWVTVSDFNSAARDGLRIARKQRAPELMMLPIEKLASQMKESSK